MARKWEIEKMRAEKFIQRMGMYEEVDKAIKNIFGEDTFLEECNNPYDYLQFTVEQGKKRVSIKTNYNFGSQLIETKVIVTTIVTTVDGGNWKSIIRFIPRYYDEYVENISFESYLRELTYKFVDNGILSWGKEND